MSDADHTTGLSTQTTRLAFAIDVTDPIAGRRVGRDLDVGIDAPTDLVVNPSGFVLALDVDSDPVTVTVDGGDRFFDERRTVYHRSDPPGATGVDATDPSDAVSITLTPRPAYPGGGRTQLRGRIQARPADGGGPLDGATVSLDGVSRESRTNAAGEYLLVVPVTPPTVVQVNGDRYVDPDAPTSGGPGSGGPSSPPSVTVTIEAPDGTTERRSLSVPVGTTTRVDHQFA